MTVSIRVYGDVQGVFFRRSAKDEADKLGVTGWVRNEADGSVVMMVVGDRKNLEKFVKWCKGGPPLSKVERVEVDWRESEQDFASFEIL
ncbi:MAG: acylphosphatase [Candidatus Curtissbacteria bacterium]|nr:acylphosphatase [Candidatus Curtissbacteria bacterium]